MLETDPLLHEQVAAELGEAIRTGDLSPGDRLPTERALSKRFSVSRTTIRRALAALAARGEVSSQQGRGTYVAEPPLEELPNELISFTELGASRGLSASARVLSAVTSAATLEEAETLQVAPGASLFTLERLRMLDGLPFSIDHSRVPLHVAPSLPTVDFTQASLYAELDERDMGPERAEYSVQAVAADERRAELLGMERDAPLLRTSQTSYAADGTVVELGVMHYRGDRYRFLATLTRRRDA